MMWRRNFLAGSGAFAALLGLRSRAAWAAAPIATALANEVAAFQALQVTTPGTNFGAVLNYFGGLKPGALVSGYSGPTAVRNVLAAYRLTGKAAPEPLKTMAGNLLAWLCNKQMWTLTIADSDSKDSNDYAYSRGSQIITLSDGTLFAIPSEYRSPAAQNGPVKSYTPEQQRLVKPAVEALFIKGVVTFFYARQRDDALIPGFSLDMPDMAVTLPLDDLAAKNRRRFFEIHDAWYDASDSTPALLLVLADEYLRTQSNDDLMAWLKKYWRNLSAAAHACVSQMDNSQTRLTFATPYTKAEYTLDNFEVLAAVRAMTRIIERANRISPAAAPSGGGPSAASELAFFKPELGRLESAIRKFLQTRASDRSPAGTFVPGWNGAMHAAFPQVPPTNPSYFDPFSLVYADEIPWNELESGPDVDVVRKAYFADMAKQGLPKISATANPQILRYLVAANAIGSPNAPFSAAAFEKWVGEIVSTIIDAGRPWKAWWNLESSCFIWLCLILLDKGLS